MSKTLRFFLAFILLALYSVCSNAQDAREECGHGSLVANENLYSIGKFNECLSGLKQCLDHHGFNYEDKRFAFQVMAMCYLAIDSVEPADNYIKQLLTTDDNFQPDASTPQRFKTEVNIIRARIRANQISSVSKRSEDINLAPATIQIITDTDIMNRGYKTLDDIFNDLPGFDVSRTGGVVNAVVYQRGYRTSNTTDQTLILVDGVEDNDMWSNADLVNLQFPMSNIKRIEVIYGPASTIYGANAFSGVINIVTKGEDDLFDSKKKNAVTATGQAGYGSFNTQYGNATIAARSKNVFFSVTGGIYHTDNENLSSYSNWNGDYNYSDASYYSALTMPYSAHNDSMLNLTDPNHIYHKDSGKYIVPTSYAISQAHYLDSTTYRKPYRGVDPGMFRNTKNDYYVSSKLDIGAFKFEFEYFNRSEGATPDYNKLNYGVNDALQNWQVRQGFMSAKYDKKLSDRFTLSSFSYYRVSDRGTDAVLTPYTSYVNGGFKSAPLDSIAKGAQPYFKSEWYSTLSNQFRTELKGVYNASEKIDFTGGTEFRTGLIQGAYANSYVPDPLVNGFDGDTTHYYYITDIGIYALASYTDREHKFNINLGGREDNDFVNGHYGDIGYGSVFNPRVAFIYYPSKYIFKAIYSEAFLDASPLNKYGTTSARLLSNPTLEPAKVRNIELSGKYLISKRTNVEVAYYHSWYTNALVTANVKDVVGNDTINTTQFQSLGRANIQGVQIAAVTTVSIFAIYANATFAAPYAVNTSSKGKDSLTRMGDISSFSANAGVNMKLLRNFNLNIRVNYVGDKPTGAGTTTTGNPNTSTPGYTLLNGTLGYHFPKVGVLQLRVDNILNTVSYAPGARTGTIPYTSSVPLPGTVYYVQYFLNLK